MAMRWRENYRGCGVSYVAATQRRILCGINGGMWRVAWRNRGAGDNGISDKLAPCGQMWHVGGSQRNGIVMYATTSIVWRGVSWPL